MNATQTGSRAPVSQPAGRRFEHVRHGSVLERPVRASDFGYLFPSLRKDPDAHLPADDPVRVVALLRRLGGAMAEPVAGETPSSTIPAVYTYWGQFIDHDLTLENAEDPALQGPAIGSPDMRPVPPSTVEQKLGNARHPYLNLDSVYGDGPVGGSADLYEGAHLRLGLLAQGGPGQPVLVARDPEHRDLPRRDAGPAPADGNRFPARIGDSRNDENLVVAQLHVAYLRFHNAVVDGISAAEPRLGTDKVLAKAQQVVRHVHQWLIINDYLRTITVPGTVDWVLSEQPRGLYLGRFGKAKPPVMPLEFSVAAFRFGHSQIRNSYDYNHNFGDPGFVARRATLDQLFQFTGRGGFIGGAPTLPFNWAIDWARFVDKADEDRRHFARPIDTQLADDLSFLRNEEHPVDIAGVQEHLAKRNLLRGYLLSIPTGEAVARTLDIRPLTAGEIVRGAPAAARNALGSSGLAGRTPLWFYVLKEAEVLTGGNSLGPVGSRIVAETVIGLIEHDPQSFRNTPTRWTTPVPTVPVAGGPDAQVGSLRDLLRVAGVLAP